MEKVINTEGLISEAKSFADRMLSEYGEFWPFLVAIDSNNKIIHIGVNLDNSAATVESLKNAQDLYLQRQIFNNKLKAGIVCYYAKITDDVKGLRDSVIMELRDGNSVKKMSFTLQP